MLGIVVALPWELKSLTRQTIRVGSCGRLSAEALVARSGIGAERASAAGALLVSQGATALLSWGFAAALDDRLKPGSVVLPERVVGATGDSYPVHVGWHRWLYRTLSAKCCVNADALLESETIASTPDAKRALAQRTQTVATDMESGALARIAQARRLPFAVVRAIVDTASTRVPENVLRVLDSSGDTNVVRFLARVFLRPDDWSAMIKLGLQFGAAQKTLEKIRGPVLEASQIYSNCISLDAAVASRG